MRLTKRDGDGDKVREVRGLTATRADGVVSVRFTDDRDTAWALTMSDEEAEELAAALLSVTPVLGGPADQTQFRLPDAPESVRRIRERAHSIMRDGLIACGVDPDVAAEVTRPRRR